MNKYVLLVLSLGIGVWACNPTTQNSIDQPIPQSPKALADRLRKLNIQIEDAIQIDSSKYLMFLLAMGETADKEVLIDTRTYKEIGHSTYWNIAFYHSGTHSYHLLDEKRRMLIYDVDLQEDDDVPRPNAKHLFYRITITDSNNDKRFNADDLTYLFVSDRTGRNLRQLSPAGYDLASYKRLKASSKVLMLVRKDSNQNRKYDQEDEQIAFIADLEDKAPAREIFNPQGKQKLKELFDRDWKRIK